MAKLWLNIKLALLALIAIYAFAFLMMNSGQAVKLWLYPTRQIEGVSMLVLIFIVFLIGVIGTLLTRAVLGTMRQLRERHEKGRSERLEREVQDMKTKAARLQTRPDDIQ